MSQQWYMSRNGNQYGPYSWNDLQNLAQQGNLGSDDLVWSNSLGNWTAASNVPNLISNSATRPSDGVVNKKNPLSNSPLGLKFSIKPHIRIMPYGRVTTAIILIVIVIGAIIAFINGDLGSLQLLL